MNLFQVASGEFDCNRSQVFLKTVQLRGARYGHDPWLLGQQPRERDLGGRNALARRHLSNEIDQRPVCLERFGSKAGNQSAEIRGVELGVFIDFTGEKARPQWTEANETDAKLFQGWENLAFRPPPPQGILALNRREGLHCVSASDRLCASFRKPEMFDFAHLDQLLYRAGDVLNRHGGVNTMLIEQVDYIDA